MGPHGSPDPPEVHYKAYGRSHSETRQERSERVAQEKALDFNTINPLRRIFEESLTFSFIQQGLGIDDWVLRLKSMDYRSDVLENPTWLQVAVHADEMIRVTNDHHHVFLEGLDKLPKKQQTEAGVTLYEFCMGS